jgi:hypothetical protein
VWCFINCWGFYHTLTNNMTNDEPGDIWRWSWFSVMEYPGMFMVLLWTNMKSISITGSRLRFQSYNLRTIEMNVILLEATQQSYVVNLQITFTPDYIFMHVFTAALNPSQLLGSQRTYISIIFHCGYNPNTIMSIWELTRYYIFKYKSFSFSLFNI